MNNLIRLSHLVIARNPALIKPEIINMILLDHYYNLQPAPRYPPSNAYPHPVILSKVHTLHHHIHMAVTARVIQITY